MHLMTFLSDTDHGLMEDLRFYALFNSRLGTSGCWEENMLRDFIAMKRRLFNQNFALSAGGGGAGRGGGLLED